MKVLILCVVFVTIGGLLSVAIGYSVEREVSSAASLIVFLALGAARYRARRTALGRGTSRLR
jgi:hypothetical protein